MVHVLITHAHYAIDAVKIVNVDHVLALNIVHQQLKLSPKERKARADPELEKTRK